MMGKTEVPYMFFKNYPLTKILINKLMVASYPSIKSSYKVKKIVDCLGKEFEIYKEIAKEKEAKISWKGTPNKSEISNPDEIREVFKELHEHRFELPYEALDMDELSNIPRVTPQEIELLKMISKDSAFERLISS